MNDEKLEVVSLKQLSVTDKIMLLRELGYQTDSKMVLNEKGEVVSDKYIGIPVAIENMLIFPGSTIILDNNELSIAKYLEEYGDSF